MRTLMNRNEEPIECSDGAAEEIFWLREQMRNCTKRVDALEKEIEGLFQDAAGADL